MYYIRINDTKNDRVWFVKRKALYKKDLRKERESGRRSERERDRQRESERERGRGRGRGSGSGPKTWSASAITC